MDKHKQLAVYNHIESTLEGGHCQLKSIIDSGSLAYSGDVLGIVSAYCAIENALKSLPELKPDV